MASIVISAGAAFYAWYASTSKARRDEVDQELDELRRRQQIIERDLDHSPSQHQIQELHNRIGDVHGELQRLSGKLDGINRLADLMNQHLLDQGNPSGY